MMGVPGAAPPFSLQQKGRVVTTISTNLAPQNAHTNSNDRRPHLAVQILGLLAFTGFAIITTVMAFVMFWAAGVVLTLAFIWFGFRPLMGQRQGPTLGADLGPAMTTAPRSSNTSFDTYRADVLRRMQDEQVSFDGFLGRLRDAKDAREFDAFMDDRARSTRDAAAGDVTADQPKPGAY